jgi:hypothetical protein
MKKVEIEIEGIVEDENELERFMEFIKQEKWVNEVKTTVRRLIPKNSIKVEEYEEI